MILNRIYLGAAALVAAFPVWGQDFKIGFPLECDLETECYIQQYVDHDPSSKSSDFTCSNLTYDGHKGTDFGLRDPRLLSRGVTVVAAAECRVIGRRDGIVDKIYKSNDAERVNAIECGNGVLIQHAGGWQTQYCHLKQGWVTVAKGQFVRQGDPLGQIGVSGKAAFPHLHLSVRKTMRDKSYVIDPFAPKGRLSCDGELETLWDPTTAYQAGGLLYVDFSDGIPDFDSIKLGQASRNLSRNSDALVAFVQGFGTKKNDVILLKINGPAGEFAQQKFIMPREQAQVTRSIGKKHTADWQSGVYTATVQLIRDGVLIDTVTNSTTIK